MEVRSIISNLPLTAFIISQASEANIRIKSKIVDQWVALDFCGSIKPLLLSSIIKKITNIRQSLVFALSATNVNGDKHTVSTSKQHSIATFDPASKTFRWIQNFAQSGTYSNVRFEVLDKALIDFMNAMKNDPDNQPLSYFIKNEGIPIRILGGVL